MTTLYFVGGSSDLTKREVPDRPDDLSLRIRQPVSTDGLYFETYRLACTRYGRPPYAVYEYVEAR